MRTRSVGNRVGSRGRGPEMLDQIEVVDERARDIVKDMLSCLKRLETKDFPSDPFDA